MPFLFLGLRSKNLVRLKFYSRKTFNFNMRFGAVHFGDGRVVFSFHFREYFCSAPRGHGKLPYLKKPLNVARPVDAVLQRVQCVV